MRRREFIAGLGSAATWPVVARAQQPGRIRRIGVLLEGGENDPVTKLNYSAFAQALAGLGWTDGSNVRIDVRWAAGNADRARVFAKEIETAIIALGREPGGGLIVMPNIFMFEHRASITSAAARNNVPAVYWDSDFARDGGLLSYGVDTVDLWRRPASYVDRILRGAKPGDLPVQFPTKFEMVVNLKTAKALGLTVPQSILLRADEVIE